MKRLFMITSAIVALASCAPVFAADLAVKAQPYGVPGFNWSGIYIGGEAGYGFSAIQLGEVGSSLASVTDPGSLGPTASGGVGGLTLAFRYQGGGSPFVFGVKAAGGITGLNSNATPDLLTQLAIANSSGGVIPGASSTRIPWDGRVGAEVGYSILPNLLLFVDGGAAFGEIKLNASAMTQVVTGAQLITQNTDNVHTGWFAGLGAKYALAPNIILGAEWVYTDLGHQGVTFQNGAIGPGAGTFDVTSHAAYNKVLGTLELKF